MEWISKELLLTICGALLIALIVEVVTFSLSKGPPQHAEIGAQNATNANQRAGNNSFLGLRSYINLTANYCTSERPNQPSEWRKKFICESKITDAVIAVLTFFLAIFTGLLVWVGNRQERTTRQQMRAFVYLDSGTIINVADPINTFTGYVATGAEILSATEGPLVRLTIKNTGSTPAMKVIHWSNIVVREFPLQSGLPPPPNVVRDGINATAIPPNGVNMKTIKLPNPLTADEISGLRNVSRAIYIYGVISYRDAFRRNRTTVYRLFHNAQTGAVGVSTDLTWAEGGNDAT